MLLKGKKALIMGVANKRSIAWGIAEAFHREGAELAFTYQNERLKENLDELAETFPVTCFLGSAKTGENVEASFLHLAKEMITTTGAPGGDEGPGLEDSEQGLIAVTDRIVMDFCDGMGGQEAAMPIVRQQLTRAGVDVKAPTVEGLRLAIEYLAETESAFRNADEVEASKLRRIGWIKELG